MWVFSPITTPQSHPHLDRPFDWSVDRSMGRCIDPSMDPIAITLFDAHDVGPTRHSLRFYHRARVSSLSWNGPMLSSGFTTARASPLETARAKVSARGVVRCDAKKSVGDLTSNDLADQVVFVRCDLNVPLDGDLNITDDTRIRAAVPTLDYLTKNGAKVLVTSHLVRD